uniref:O-fucosyltransferase family protein n=1 Tax=Aureoumbra lagunensis TaxID=44058 RepID=A0A7S3NKG5_9STRA
MPSDDEKGKHGKDSSGKILARLLILAGAATIGIVIMSQRQLVKNNQERFHMSAHHLGDAVHGPATWLSRSMHDALSRSTDIGSNKDEEILDVEAMVADLSERLTRIEARRTFSVPVVSHSQAKYHEEIEESMKDTQTKSESAIESKPGKLMCEGKEIKSEVVYWKDVSSDKEYIAPTAKQDSYEQYLTFEYDMGGWNNVRMGVECIVVVAHATGRTLVVPPPQNLYLLGAPQIDPKTGKKKHKKLGFSDFFNLDALRSHKGLKVLTMEAFLQRQLVELKLQSKLPPGNKTDLWGKQLWSYLGSIADGKPMWSGTVLAMPDDFPEPGNEKERQLIQQYAAGRRLSRYQEFTNKRHLHIPAGGKHRLLQHFYTFTVFRDSYQRNFYRRLIRDSMRYIDPVHCAGNKMIQAIQSISQNLGFGGKYYALHIRRGDFQYKNVKLPASTIVQNLKGNTIIPRNSLVYIATDDPQGTCEHCRSGGKLCPPANRSAPQSSYPPGCMADPSWDAFINNGWILVFSRNFTTQHESNVAGALDGVNPNYLGLIETIICSRAEAFAGTWFSTFTGYIHRLRGYHGLAESTYYHSNGKLDAARSSQSIGAGYAREWRIGWTTDNGRPIRRRR